MLILYLLTINCQQKKNVVVKSDITDVIIWLKMNIDSLMIIESHYETSGKYKQLHWHGIVAVKHGFYYKPYTQYGDNEHTNGSFQIHWSRVFNKRGALRYVRKDIKT